MGLSKRARLVDVYALRLQMQERMTVQIVNALVKYLRPRGAACIVRPEHGSEEVDANDLLAALLCHASAVAEAIGLPLHIGGVQGRG